MNSAFVRVFCCILAAVTILCMSTVALTQPATKSMKPMTLLYNGGIHTENSVEGQCIKWFGTQVEQRTNGLLKFTYIWSFGLTRPGEEIDAIKSMQSPIGQTPITYYPAKLFLSNIAYAVPFVPDDLMSQAKTFSSLFDGIPAMREEYEKLGVKLLSFGVSNKWFVEARTPITRLEDFKGKKLAISGVYAPKWVQVLGATTLPTTLMDRAHALDTRMLDGSIMDIVVTYPFKLYEFVKHTTYLGLGCWLGHVGMINLKLFNDLPGDVQKVLVDTGREMSFKYSELIDSHLEKVKGVMMKEGVKFYTLSDADRTRWMKMVGNAPATWVQEAEARGLPGKETMNLYLKLIRETGYKFPAEWETLPK